MPSNLFSIKKFHKLQNVCLSTVTTKLYISLFVFRPGRFGLHKWQLAIVVLRLYH